MIKVNLLKDQTAAVEKKQQKAAATPKISRIGLAYIAAIIVVTAAMGYLWRVSGNAISETGADNRRFESELKALEELRRQSAELEQKKQEHQNRINIIEKLLESQKGPVRMLNAVIQAVPQNNDVWLTSLEQNGGEVRLKGATRNPETLPDFMNSLAASGIFAGIDIEQIERRDEISSFSILCAGRQSQ